MDFNNLVTVDMDTMMLKRGIVKGVSVALVAAMLFAVSGLLQPVQASPEEGDVKERPQERNFSRPGNSRADPDIVNELFNVPKMDEDEIEGDDGSTLPEDDSEGMVLGETSDADMVCDRLTTFIKLGAVNDSADVSKLQEYLNNYEGEVLAVTGEFDAETFEAVKRYQAKYSSEILAPWGITVPSGFVYRTTRRHINAMMCGDDNVAFTTYHVLNDVDGDVSKIETFLSDMGYLGEAVGNEYDVAVESAVKVFQSDFSVKILVPWGLSQSTGNWFKTTRKTANEIIGFIEEVAL